MNPRLSVSLVAALLVATLVGCAGRPPSGHAAPVQAGCSPTAGTPAGTAASLLAVLANARSEHKLNAIIFRATIDSKDVLTTALGDSTPGVPASTAMHFRVGMPAEQFETTMLMQLVDQRRIALDDRVATWFPKYPHAGATTVRMLGASSSGFGDYVYGPGTPAKNVPSFESVLYRDPYRQFTASELIARSQAPYQVPQYANPGADWQYSHTNYAMLGSILERVTGRDYGALLQDSIAKKLGLRDIVYSTSANIQAPVLHAFTSERSTYEDSTKWSPSWTSFSGSMNSTVCDLATWEQAFGSGALLTPASAAEIVAPTNVGLGKNSRSLYFGLGTIVNNGWLLANGNYFGWHTATAYYPPQRIALVVTLTEGPKTTSGNALTNGIFKAMSSVLTPKSPITIP